MAIFLSKNSSKMQRKETLHCPGILGQVSYSIVFRTSLNNFFSNAIIFYSVMAIFLSKNSSKMHSHRPNTMRETLPCPSIFDKASYR